MQDLKTGHLCHASPRAQFYGQLIGSSLSIVVTATAFALYNRAYTIPGPSFPAPTAYVWLGLARLLRKSSQTVPGQVLKTNIFQAMDNCHRTAHSSWWSFPYSSDFYQPSNSSLPVGTPGLLSGYLPVLLLP